MATATGRDDPPHTQRMQVVRRVAVRQARAVRSTSLAVPPALPTPLTRVIRPLTRGAMSTPTAPSVGAGGATGASSSTAATSTVPADFVTFVNEAPSPYHATAAVEKRLVAAGFEKLSERDEAWSVKPGGKYYVVRNQSAYIAFAVGGKYVPGNGFTIAASHTDSPCLRVKPVSTLTKSGYLSLGVETYGGGLWYTWLDRDLSVAGRAVVAKPGGGFDSRLVRIDTPICRVPSLAIHLHREVNTEGLKLNAETHLAPVLATAVKTALLGTPPTAGGATTTDTPGTGDATTRHHAALVDVLATNLGVPPTDVKDFDLCVYDTQPATIGGIHREFIFSARLDNLMMTYTTMAGLVDSVSGTGSSSFPLADDCNIRMAASFDHEEVGSASVPGAGSTFLQDTLQRLCPDASKFPAAIRKSILVSADMAHAVHPNYSALHEENHRPAMHGGIVIKCNSNQRYATTSITAFILRQIGAEAKVPVQNFVVRQDMGCGSTIGPIVATRLGLRTVDVGMPQLSMHSCREMCGCDDAAHAVKYFGFFYGRFPTLDASMEHAD